MGRLFGTDGVRGKAGDYPLDVPTVRRLGAALARSLGHHGGAVRFLAGRDTRESGSWIERELAFGMAGQGAQYVSAGVIPTPAIAYLTPRLGFTAGVVISASHNPFGDNGIKVFSGSGEKFTEAVERQVETVYDRDGEREVVRYRLATDRPQSIGRVRSFFGNVGVLVRAYAYLRTHGPDGLKAVADNAVLNANYLLSQVSDFLAVPQGDRCMHEFVASAAPVKKAMASSRFQGASGSAGSAGMPSVAVPVLAGRGSVPGAPTQTMAASSQKAANSMAPP